MLTNKIKSRLGRINSTGIFIWISFIFIFTLIIEAITFKGFIGKHLFISTTAIQIAVLLVGVHNLISKQQKPFVSFRKLRALLLSGTIITFAIYTYLGCLDKLNFPNYVYSKFHIVYTNIAPIISFCLLLTLIIYSFNHLPLIKIRSINKRYVAITYIIFVLLGYYFITNFNHVLAQINDSLSYIVANPKASYNQKMSTYWGISVFYNERIKTLVPENSNIVLPPQNIYWGVTGNIGVERYFLYPRGLANGTENYLPVDAKYNYIVVSPGNELGGGNYKLWPDFKIKSNYIYFIDPISGEVTTKAQNYNPLEFLDKSVWGLIQVN